MAMSVDEEIRLNRNASTIDLFFTQVGLSYTLSKNWKASFNYRFIRKNQLDYWETRHGFFADLAWKKRLKPLTFTLRGRLQGRGGEDQFFSGDGFSPDWFFRGKLQIQYDLGRRLTPFASLEAFWLLNAPYSPEMNGDLTRFRYEAGLEYEINRKHSIGISYMLQHNRLPLFDEYILTTGYAFSF